MLSLLYTMHPWSAIVLWVRTGVDISKYDNRILIAPLSDVILECAGLSTADDTTTTKTHQSRRAMQISYQYQSVSI